MTRVVLQPAGSPKSKKHYEHTVENTVSLAESVGLGALDRATLEVVFPENAARFWGVTPASNGAHVKRHSKLRSGDVVLFVKERRVFSRARIRHPFRNQELAKQLWDVDDNGKIWELMYAIDEVTDVNIAVSDINELVGYHKDNVVQGFMVLDDEQSAKVLDYLGEPVDDPNPAKVPDDLALSEFKPKSDADYVAAVQANVQVRTRRHEKLIADFGAAAVNGEFVPATNVHPRDLTLERDGAHWLVEAKVVYKGDATSAVRAVVGQLLQYRHFLYKNGNQPKLLALFSESVGDAYVQFLEGLGIASVWRNAGAWSASTTAAEDGLAFG